jgi:glutathione S-transferase
MEDPSVARAPLKAPPTLHHLANSQSLRVLWALEELAADGQPYELKTYMRVKGRAPVELQSIYPLGLSPILTIGPLPGSSEQERTVVTETRLILKCLADNYSNGIWEPSNLDDKHRTEYWQEFAGATLTARVDFVLLFDVIPSHMPWLVRPLANVVFLPIAKVMQKDLARPFKLMEDALSEQKPWFSGEKMGQADFSMSWPMDLAQQRGYFDAKLYPKVADWHRRIQERPAYKRALEKGGPYDLVNF